MTEKKEHNVQGTNKSRLRQLTTKKKTIKVTEHTKRVTPENTPSWGTIVLHATTTKKLQKNDKNPKMMLVALLLCLLLSPVQGGIVSLSAENYLEQPPYQLDSVDPLTGKFTNITDLDDPSYPMPTCSAVQNNNTIVYCNVFPGNFSSSLVTMDLSTGKIIQVSKPYRWLSFFSIAFDKVTHQTFAIGVNLTVISTLYEVLPDQTLREMAVIPGANFGTFSSSKHIFFLAMTPFIKPFTKHVVAMGTSGQQEGKILYNVSVDFWIHSMVFDDTFDVLYVWGSNATHHAILVSLDYTTGKFLKTFVESTTLFAGPICTINAEGSTLYSFLYDQNSNHSVIHSVDLASGKTSQAPAKRFAMTMNFA